MHKDPVIYVMSRQRISFEKPCNMGGRIMWLYIHYQHSNVTEKMMRNNKLSVLYD